MTIQRYDMHGPSGYDDWGYEPSNAGRWVEYSDHLADKEAALAAQAERVRGLEVQVSELGKLAAEQASKRGEAEGRCMGLEYQLAALRERVRQMQAVMIEAEGDYPPQRRHFPGHAHRNEERWDDGPACEQCQRWNAAIGDRVT